jgi:adenine-specific DNA-methyltransferase
LSAVIPAKPAPDSDPGAGIQKAGKDWTPASAGVTKEAGIPKEIENVHADWWQARIARQKEIDASISAKAEFEYLYDKPYENKKIVRVRGRSPSRASCRTACCGWTRTTS